MNELTFLLGLYKRPPTPYAIDGVICWAGWGDYYHASVIDWRDKSEWASTARKGVHHNTHWGDDYDACQIEVYNFKVPLTPEEIAKGEAFWSGIDGCGYDYWGLMGFIIHRHIASDTRYFCSEADFEFCDAVNRTLLNNIRADQVMPVQLTRATVITKIGYLIKGKGDNILMPVNGIITPDVQQAHRLQGLVLG